MVAPSRNGPSSPSGIYTSGFTTIAYPAFLLMAVALLLLESNYRPDSVPRFMAFGGLVVGPGFWSAWLLIPFGIMLTSGIVVAFKGRPFMTRSGLRRSTVLLALAGAGYVLLLGSTVALSPFRPEVVAVGKPSASGCQIYFTRQDVLSGAGGELFLHPPGDLFLTETKERWASRGGPDFDLNQYIKVSWDADVAAVRDASGDDPNMFYYRGTESFAC